MSVELLGGRERKWCRVLGKEKWCVESWNHCKWSYGPSRPDKVAGNSTPTDTLGQLLIPHGSTTIPLQISFLIFCCFFNSL